MEINKERVSNLIEYVQGIKDLENGQELYAKYKKDIEGVTPQEAFDIFFSQLQKGVQPSEVLKFLDKVINIFYKSLVSFNWKKPDKNSFADYLMQENRALEEKLDYIKKIIKDGGFRERREALISKVRELKQFNHHYLKKENILFPYLEKQMEKFNGLSIMWALHDEVRAQIKKVLECLEEESCKEEKFNIEIGKLFFAMHGLIKKEELILFPAASQVITEDEWKAMQKQSLEYEFPYIKGPEKEAEIAADTKAEYYFKTETGSLNVDELLMIFNIMPVDITFVDEDNKVRFYSDSKDRIFPRSPAIIGRNVEKCHPPQSVHVVNKILDAFKAGTKEKAVFWINLKDKKIMIQYFALRDKEGSYRGVLEVSQDITEIIKLEGERRLLNWEE